MHCESAFSLVQALMVCAAAATAAAHLWPCTKLNFSVSKTDTIEGKSVGSSCFVVRIRAVCTRVLNIIRLTVTACLTPCAAPLTGSVMLSFTFPPAF